jgi:hypothetical protein
MMRTQIAAQIDAIFAQQIEHRLAWHVTLQGRADGAIVRVASAAMTSNIRRPLRARLTRVVRQGDAAW